MKRSERKQWAAARTLADLGELTAQWLEGRITYYPGYGTEEDPGPAPEAADLIPVLTRLNRAGFVTEDSQPGEQPVLGSSGRYWQQRAAVSGFGDDVTLGGLVEAVTGTGLLLIAHRTETPPWWHAWLPRRLRPELAWGDGAVPVSAATDCTVNYWCGGQASYDDIEPCFDGVGAKAFAAVLAAWQVSLIDPEFGRNEVLWPVLDEWASHRAHGSAVSR